MTIVNPQGLHARPADLFARLASRFQSSIEVVKEGQRANGKSILELLMLAAGEGTILTIVARGGDAQEAVESLADLLIQKLREEQTADQNGIT